MSFFSVLMGVCLILPCLSAGADTVTNNSQWQNYSMVTPSTWNPTWNTLSYPNRCDATEGFAESASYCWFDDSAVPCNGCEIRVLRSRNGCRLGRFRGLFGPLVPDSNPPNLGGQLNQILEAQIRNGRLSQLTFYSFDFQVAGQNQKPVLSAAGKRKVALITKLWILAPGPIVVNGSGNDEADLARVQMIRLALNKAGLPDDIVVRVRAR
ncbi:MAG: hypothetical protein P8M80_17160 [Pirellulaceae bacterium]|nr:hypothetical protein [Pirellulaceae bacterium]